MASGISEVLWDGTWPRSVPNEKITVVTLESKGQLPGAGLQGLQSLSIRRRVTEGFC
jgi:hypothetical protein